MRLTEIVALHKSPERSGSDTDRFTRFLIWIAFVLIAAVAAITSDLWLQPISQGPVAQAIVSTPLPLTPSPASELQPTVEDTRLAAEPTPNTAVTNPMELPPCVPPDDWGMVIVQSGNTLLSLARRYGTNIDTLMHVNCLNTDTIFVGQRLYVPGPLPSPSLPMPLDAPTPSSQPDGTPYPGDSATPSSGAAMAQALPSPTAPKSPFQVNIPDRFMNIVLLGSDKRPNSGAWRTDSMIVVSVDMQDNVVRLLSIPRDLWVYIPGHGYNRINTADLWGELAKKGGGPERVKQTIYQNLGIPVQYYVRVDFQGFMKIIDTVGGIDIDVDCPLPDINLSAGMHHMDGAQALRYARSRKSTNDFDRGRRQRKVLMALWDQALTMDLVPKLPQLWRTMADSFQTDLPLEQVINLAYVGTQLQPQRIISRAITAAQVQNWTTPEGAAVLLPREDKIRALLESFYGPVDTAQLDGTSRLRVRVLNGSKVGSAAQLAAAALKWDGLKVVATGQADRQDYARTQILVYAGDVAAGETIARQIQVPVTNVQNLVGQDQPDPADPVDIVVILGRDYDPCQR
jgi:LCP family protein required for cell wall assembly